MRHRYVCFGRQPFPPRQIFVPINTGNMHWTIAVIDMHARRIDYMDSMSGSGMGCMENLQRYLEDEAANKGFDDSLTGFALQTRTEVPQQENGCDCGVFTCKFADFEAMERQCDFSQEHMQYFRRRMVAEILESNAE